MYTLSGQHTRADPVVKDIGELAEHIEPKQQELHNTEQQDIQEEPQQEPIIMVAEARDLEADQ